MFGLCARSLNSTFTHTHTHTHDLRNSLIWWAPNKTKFTLCLHMNWTTICLSQQTHGQWTTTWLSHKYNNNNNNNKYKWKQFKRHTVHKMNRNQEKLHKTHKKKTDENEQINMLQIIVLMISLKTSLNVQITFNFYVKCQKPNDNIKLENL